MSQVRFGLIGAGAIAHVACQSMASHEQAKIVAAHDPHAERLSELCSAFEIGRSHTTVESLLSDDEVDAVYIATPNKFHAPLAIQALKAGKHVLLDKPFAMNLSEAKEVAATVASTGKTLMLGMNLRYREDSQKIRSIVDRGVLGEVYHAKAYWFRRAGIPRLGTWFGNKEMAGGGALLDIGVHVLDLCLHTMGNFEPVAVSGSTYTKFGNRGLGEGKWGRSDPDRTITFDVDDFATALIKFRNGATVSLDVSWACHAEDESRMGVHLFGTEAGASLFPTKVFRNDPLRADYDVIDNVQGEVAYPHFDRIHNFTNVLLGTEQPCCTVEQALVVQSILDAIYESCRTGQEVRIESLQPAGA